MHRPNRVRSSLVALLLLTISSPCRAQSAADSVKDAPVRFLVGRSRLTSIDAADGVSRATWGTALGLRFGYPSNARLRLDFDIRLHAAELRGPCTMREAARRGCNYEADAHSIGDLSASFGISAAPARWIRMNGLVSPGLNSRGLDRIVASDHANWSAHPWSYAFGLDVAALRSSRLLVEYRMLKSASYQADSESMALVGATRRQFRGTALAAMLSLPLRPTVRTAAKTVSTAAKKEDDTSTPAPAWTGFGVVIENDLPWRDESYTNGLRAFVAEVPIVRELLSRFGHFGLERDAVACPYGGQTVDATTRFCRVTQVALTQTMHTPVAIYLEAPQRRDRPFAGTLFASARTDLLRHTAWKAATHGWHRAPAGCHGARGEIRTDAEHGTLAHRDGCVTACRVAEPGAQPTPRRLPWRHRISRAFHESHCGPQRARAESLVQRGRYCANQHHPGNHASLSQCGTGRSMVAAAPRFADNDTAGPCAYAHPARAGKHVRRHCQD
jgi:hypothetical protein